MKVETVKNGLSNLTKVQMVRIDTEHDVRVTFWRKALKEGCCERKRARMVVSSTEKMDTKET